MKAATWRKAICREFTNDEVDRMLTAIENLKAIASQRDELLEACKAALPLLERANIHGSRCEEELAATKAAIAKAEGGEG